MNFIKDILLNPNPFINKKKDSDFFLPFLCLFAFTFSINLSSFANFCKPPQVADTIFVYDTIYVKEVVRDTVVINIYGKDITKEKNNNKIKPKKFKYSIDFLLATGITETSFSGKGRYDQNIALKKSAISLLPGFSSSIMFNYNFKKKHKFQIGLCFTEIREKFNYKSEAFDIKSTWSYLYYNTIVQKIDTIWFLDIDQLLHGDSVWVPYLYQYNTIKKDSIYSEKIDSTKLFYHDDIVNKYYYFEIPLIYGYKYKFKKYTLTPEIGIISSFILKYKGKTVSLGNFNKAVDFQKESKPKLVLFSLYLGLGINKEISEKIGIIGKFFVCQSVTHFYKNYPILLKRRTTGISLGVYYRF